MFLNVTDLSSKDYFFAMIFKQYFYRVLRWACIKRQKTPFRWKQRSHLVFVITISLPQSNTKDKCDAHVKTIFRRQLGRVSCYLTIDDQLILILKLIYNTHFNTSGTAIPTLLQRLSLAQIFSVSLKVKWTKVLRNFPDECPTHTTYSPQSGKYYCGLDPPNWEPLGSGIVLTGSIEFIDI